MLTLWDLISQYGQTHVIIFLDVFVHFVESGIVLLGIAAIN